MASAKTAELKSLKWPTAAVDLTGDGVPVQLDKLLQSLQLVATDEDRDISTAKSWNVETPASMQVIKSGALGITKNSIAWIGSVGGITGASAAIAGVLTTFVGDVGEPVTIALMGSAALILSSVAIALALFVKGDLEARGVATAARHQGRADVVSAFLAATGAMPSKKKPEVAPASGRTLLDDFLEVLRAYPDKVVSRQQARQRLSWSSVYGGTRPTTNCGADRHPGLTRRDRPTRSPVLRQHPREPTTRVGVLTEAQKYGSCLILGRPAALLSPSPEWDLLSQLLVGHRLRNRSVCGR